MIRSSRSVTRHRSACARAEFSPGRRRPGFRPRSQYAKIHALARERRGALVVMRPRRTPGRSAVPIGSPTPPRCAPTARSVATSGPKSTACAVPTLPAEGALRGPGGRWGRPQLHPFPARPYAPRASCTGRDRGHSRTRATRVSWWISPPRIKATLPGLGEGGGAMRCAWRRRGAPSHSPAHSSFARVASVGRVEAQSAPGGVQGRMAPG